MPMNPHEQHIQKVITHKMPTWVSNARRYGLNKSQTKRYIQDQIDRTRQEEHDHHVR
jgi:hypothetical protein